jgi:hypothetical protein
MVSYDKHTYFCQRHSESVQQMTSFDIRETVLSSATAEARARTYALIHRSRLVDSLLHGSPGFVLQATPVVPPETPIDVFADGIVQALRGIERNSIHGGDRNGLGSMPVPKPSLEGIQGCDSREDTRWISEVHRNGYIGVGLRLDQYEKSGQQNDGPYCLREHHQHIFHAFGELCESIILAMDFDPPYIVDCTFENANGTSLVAGRFDLSNKLERERIEWPPSLRQPGESFRPIMDEFIRILYNAYGLRKQ